MKLVRFFFISFFVFVIAGCSNSLQTIHNITNDVPAGLNQDQVKTVIDKSAERHGWARKEIDSNTILLNIERESWSNYLNVNVKVIYSDKEYSLVYLNSTGFKDNGFGMIAPKYNRWVNNLAKDIQTKLEILANGTEKNQK